MKAKGKCTTDHISAAGPWLKYRGHLENISGNLFLGAVNAFTGEAGDGQGPARRRDHARSPTSPSTYHEAGVALGAPSATRTTARARPASTPPWSPASAAPRSILARSFARIHETNLKKQGMLPLTFADPATYDQIGEDDRISRPRPGRPRARRAGALPRSPSPTAPRSTSRATRRSAPSRSSGSRPAGALNIIRQDGQLMAERGVRRARGRAGADPALAVVRSRATAATTR